MKWIKKLVPELCRKLTPEGRVIVMELDDVALFAVKNNKLWIWKAYCQHTGGLLDWECGDRSGATLERLLDRLAPWKPLFYFTDDFKAYRALIPANRFFQGKDGTHGIEKNNGRQPH